MSRKLIAAALAAAMLTLAACGGQTASAGDGDPAPPGETPEPGDPAAPEAPDEFDEEAERVHARSLLGQAEDELSEFVRVGRRGAEQFALIEDYVLGRVTVELDADGAGVYRVVSATVELLDGPERFEE